MLTVMDVDLDLIQEMFIANGTKCEHPLCSHEPKPAYGVYQNGVVFMFLCGPHWEWATALTGLARLDWDKQANSRMMQLMRKLSYVHTNMASNFALEEALDARKQVERAVNRAEKNEQGRVRRNLRKEIRESGEKIGSPDESLAAARAQGSDKQTGQPQARPTPRPTGKVNLLIPRLVIGAMTTKEESQ